MTRTIETIAKGITDEAARQVPALNGSETAKTSKTSEWKLWAHIMASAIHAFEYILDLFRKEMDALTEKITPGTLRWYAEIGKRFQNGDTLKFDEKTAMLYYPEENAGKRIIAAVAVMEGKDDEGQSCLYLKVAKKENGTEKILPLSEDERENFSKYMEAVKFAGVQLKISSTNADQIRYTLSVYHDPAIAGESIGKAIREALDAFKTDIDFNGILYRQKFIDAVMGVDGVVTCTLDRFEQHGADDAEDVWHEIETHTELKAGYFDYAKENQDDPFLRLYSINQLINKK